VRLILKPPRRSRCKARIRRNLMPDGGHALTAAECRNCLLSGNAENAPISRQGNSNFVRIRPNHRFKKSPHCRHFPQASFAAGYLRMVAGELLLSYWLRLSSTASPSAVNTLKSGKPSSFKSEAATMPDGAYIAGASNPPCPSPSSTAMPWRGVLSAMSA
jgi:hypothetical protein